MALYGALETILMEDTVMPECECNETESSLLDVTLTEAGVAAAINSENYVNQWSIMIDEMEVEQRGNRDHAADETIDNSMGSATAEPEMAEPEMAIHLIWKNPKNVKNHHPRRKGIYLKSTGL